MGNILAHTRGPWIVIPKGGGFPDITISGPAPDDVTKARYMPIATVHTYKNTTYPCFYEVTDVTYYPYQKGKKRVE